MSIEHVTPEEAKALMDQNPELRYVDVRSIPEFKAGHPDKAMNIPLLHRTNFGMELNPDFVQVCEQVLNKEQKILIGCQAGGRSLKACMILEQNEFTQLINVCGGFGGGQHPETGEPVTGWRDAGLPVSTSDGESESYDSLVKKHK